MQKLFSVVINHYASQAETHQLVASCLFSAALSSTNPLVLEVLVVDGSSDADPHLAGELSRIGCRYIHDGRRLTFAEGYNLGIQHCSGEWVALCASDVYPSLNFFEEVQKLIDEVSPQDIGCIVPRLTFSDLFIQQSTLFRRETLRLPVMTLNLNVLQRSFLEEIGGVPQEYSGGYNDILMSMQIYRRGRAIFMIPARCTHFGRLTLKVGGSNFSYEKDRDRFSKEHPEMVDHGYLWDLRVSQLMTSKLARSLWAASRLVKNRKLRHPAGILLLSLACVLQRFPRRSARGLSQPSQ